MFLKGGRYYGMFLCWWEWFRRDVKLVVKERDGINVGEVE